VKKKSKYVKHGAASAIIWKKNLGKTKAGGGAKWQG